MFTPGSRARIAWMIALSALPAPALLAEDAPPPAQTPSLTPPLATTFPTTRPREMLWDRARLTVEAAQREAAARRALQAAEAGPDTTSPAATARIRAARQALEEARQAAVARVASAARPAFEKAAYLGVASSAADPAMRKQLHLPNGVGLVVDYVEPGSPAAAGGLKAYDVATKLNDQILINPAQLAVLVRTFEPGTQVTITLVRAGQPTTAAVKLEERDVKPLADVFFGSNRVGAFSPAAPDDPALFDIGDTIKVRVMDLEGPGLETAVETRVTPKGFIFVPGVRFGIPAFQQSEKSLAKAIVAAYRECHLLDAANVGVEFVSRAKPGEKPAIDDEAALTPFIRPLK